MTPAGSFVARQLDNAHLILEQRFGFSGAISWQVLAIHEGPINDHICRQSPLTTAEWLAIVASTSRLAAALAPTKGGSGLPCH
jgi:hypothetical protein